MWKWQTGSRETANYLNRCHWDYTSNPVMQHNVCAVTQNQPKQDDFTLIVVARMINVTVTHTQKAKDTDRSIPLFFLKVLWWRERTRGSDPRQAERAARGRGRGLQQSRVLPPNARRLRERHHRARQTGITQGISRGNTAGSGQEADYDDSCLEEGESAAIFRQQWEVFSRGENP